MNNVNQIVNEWIKGIKIAQIHYNKMLLSYTEPMSEIELKKDFLAYCLDNKYLPS